LSDAASPKKTWEPLGLLVFVLLPLRTLLEPTLPLRDPGTGWHLVQGRLILESGRIPVADAFSFTAPGAEWVSYYWLFETVAAALERIGGLPLYVAAAVLVYAVIPVLLFGRMLRMGVGSLLAALFAVLAQILLMGHALARPHIATYLAFALVVDRIQRFDEGQAAAGSLAWLPLLALLWCNLHGGFVAGLAIVSLYAAMAGARCVATRDPHDRRRARVLAGCAFAMAVATLVNPAGPWLHVSIFDYLGMESTPRFVENAGLTFGPGLGSWLLEGVILGFIALLATRARLAWTEVALLAFLLHESLQVVRHVNLFVIAAVPILARETARAIEHSFPALGPALRRRFASERSVTGRLAYAGFAAVFLALAGLGALPYPKNLDGTHLSAEAAAFIDSHPDRFARPFNTDNLGGSLIYRFWPRLHVFVDDRTPIYGDRFITDDYLKVIDGEVGWDEVLTRWGIQDALVTTESTSARLLDASPAWNAVHRDPLVTIFFRAPETPRNP
jgi:hypothetical protein